MDADVDAYLAQHNIPSVVSDMLFELTFHRPKEIGKFIAGYVERRFQLDLAGGGGNDSGKLPSGQPAYDDFATIEVRGFPPSLNDGGVASEAKCCALLEEARLLRLKYLDFQPAWKAEAATARTLPTLVLFRGQSSGKTTKGSSRSSTIASFGHSLSEDWQCSGVFMTPTEQSTVVQRTTKVLVLWRGWTIACSWLAVYRLATC